MLKKFLRLKKETVVKAVSDYLEVKPKGTVGKTAWLFKLGQTPTVLVAHIDTVERAKRLKLVYRKGKIYAKNSVLGADDRAGVVMAMLLAKELGVDLLLTDFEESGGIGASDAGMEFSDELAEKNIFIEFDRRGYKNWVQYCRTDNDKEIQAVLEPFGFVKEYGSYSDVATLSDMLNVGHVNLAVAYYNQHTKDEYLDVDQFWELFEMYKHIVPALAYIKTSAICSYGEKLYNDGLECPYCLVELTDKFDVRGRTVYQCSYCGCIVDETMVLDKEVIT